MSERIKVFVFYDHEDLIFLEKLKKFLRPLEKEGLIKIWSNADISPGIDWETTIELFKFLF